MTTRVLPSAEWPRLAHTELGAVWTQLSPSTTTVFVVEDEAGAIIGCWSLLTLLHAEGIWIDPAHRKSAAVARRLLLSVLPAARGTGAASILTSAIDPEVEQLLEHAGATKVPGTLYAWPIAPEKD